MAGFGGAALAYADLGLLVAASGDVPRAAALVEQGLRRLAAIGDQLVFLIALASAAQIAATAGDAAAARLLGAVRALRAQCGPSIWAVARPVYERAAALSRRFLDEQRFGALCDEGNGLSVEAAIAAASAALEQITSVSLTATPQAPPPTPVLSPRELAVLRLVMVGQTDSEIALTLGLQVRTVNTYVANARRKLRAPSRAAAVAEVIRRGLA